jgi:Spy/CpxP family protein refolding chaperone
MIKPWIIIVIILLSLINLSALGTLIYYRCCPPTASSCIMDKTMDHGCYMKEHLNMSEEQAANLSKVEKSSRSITDALAVTMKEKRIKLVEELMKDKPDSSRIEDILRSVDSLQENMQREVVKRLLHEKNVLTPQQQEKFFSLVLGQFCMEVDSIKKTQCQNNKSQ